MKAIIALTALVSGLLSGGYALQAKSSRGYIDSKCERSQVLILYAISFGSTRQTMLLTTFLQRSRNGGCLRGQNACRERDP